MSTIATMLKAKQPLFDHALLQLEALTGRQGVDAELAGEMTTKAIAAAGQLGLGPQASGPELYEALIRRVKIDDEHLAASLGGHDPADVPQMLPLVVGAVSNMDLPRRGWFIKETVAKELLRRMPPPAVMQRLGRTSTEDLLAGEDIYELFLALRFAEAPDWLNRFDAGYSTLTPADFEQRDIRIVRFDVAKWGDIAEPFIAKKLHNVANSKEMGAIGLMPMRITHMPGVTLKVLPLIIHYHNEIRLYSSYFQLIKHKRNFGQIVATTLVADPAHVQIIDGPNIHWRVIQRYFGKLPHEQHPEIFEPHLQPEDLHWRRAEDELYQLDPELEFWRDLDYVAVLKPGLNAASEPELVTLNLMDVSLSYSNGLSYPDRYLYHFREALWNEVFARYFGQPALQRQLLEKLDNEVIKPEELEA